VNQVALSVVVPAYNSSGWIIQCLTHLRRALSKASLLDCDVIVVDDGSTDGTGDEAESFGGLNLTVVRQANLGRFKARQNGLALCKGTHVLFLDTRVFIGEDSLDFVLPHLQRPETSLWTADVQVNTTKNPIARFWRAIEGVFWSRYMRHPRTTSFGIADFDYYPKGTTALIAPIPLIRSAIESFKPTVTDWRKVNDDTALLRYAAERTQINISPSYTCTYNARTTLRAFLKHANHRGSVLIDGYLRSGTRLNFAIWAVLFAAPVGSLMALFFWKLALTTAVAIPLVLFVAVLSRGIRFKDAVVLSGLFWPFAVYYLAGMYWGLWLKLSTRHLIEPVN
jgi:glycosyltransferase involved in cell wall biosynthesis